MPDIQEIIRKIASSQAKFSILKLFKENPYVMDNRFGLSLWVGKPEEAISPELEEMVELGVVHRWGTEPGAIYAYARDKELRQLIEDHWDELSRLAHDSRWKQERVKTESFNAGPPEEGSREEGTVNE